MSSLTPERVEELKTREKFDRELAAALIPRSHPAQRRWVKHPLFGQDVATAIKDHVDPTLRVFISKGCKKIPRRVYDRRVARTGRQIKAGPELRRLLRSFLHVCMVERGGVPNRAEFRQAVRNTENLILELVRRNRELIKNLFGA